MNTEPIAEAIENRLKADSQLWTGSAWTINGSATSGITQVVGNPKDMITPYVVFSVGLTSEGVLRGHLARADITFTIVYQPAIAADTVGKSKLLDRIFGDSSLQSGQNPTFGLHNFAPTMPTNTYALVLNECCWRSTSAVQAIDTTYAMQTITFSVNPSVNGIP